MDLAGALLIAIHDARRTLRSARALALLTLFVGSFLLSGLGFVLAAEKATRTLLEAAPPGTSAESVQEQARAELFRGLVRDPDWAASLTATPSVVLFFFGAALLFLPALVCVMSYDAVAGELQNRSIRYTLLRCDRTAYLLGKLTGQTLLLAVFTSAVGVVLLGAAEARIPGFRALHALPWLARYELLAILYGAVFVALALLASTLTRLPLLALLLSFCGLFVFGVLWALGASGSLGFLSVLSPFAHLPRLFAPDLAGVAAAVGIYLIFLAALGGAALAALHVRDV